VSVLEKNLFKHSINQFNLEPFLLNFLGKKMVYHANKIFFILTNGLVEIKKSINLCKICDL